MPGEQGAVIDAKDTDGYTALIFELGHEALMQNKRRAPKQLLPRAKWAHDEDLCSMLHLLSDSICLEAMATVQLEIEEHDTGAIYDISVSSKLSLAGLKAILFRKYGFRPEEQLIGSLGGVAFSNVAPLSVVFHAAQKEPIKLQLCLRSSAVACPDTVGLYVVLPGEGNVLCGTHLSLQTVNTVRDVKEIIRCSGQAPRPEEQTLHLLDGPARQLIHVPCGAMFQVAFPFARNV